MAEAGLRSGDRIVAARRGGARTTTRGSPCSSFGDVVEGVRPAMMDREPLRLQVARAARRHAHAATSRSDTLDPGEARPALRKLGLRPAVRSPAHRRGGRGRAPPRPRACSRATWS
jgi:hypothetical protein